MFNAEMKWLREKLRELPKDTGNGESYSSVGETNPSHKQPLAEVTQIINLFNLKKWITVDAPQYLMQGIEDALVDELVTQSTEF